MSIARVIEIEDLTAGIVLPHASGHFRFFSSNRLFDRLESQSFGTVKEAVAAVHALLARNRRSRAGQDARSPDAFKPNKV
jgi:hypothetical protein